MSAEILHGTAQLRHLVDFLAPAKWIGGVDREALAALLAERDSLVTQLELKDSAPVETSAPAGAENSHSRSGDA